MGTVFSKVVHEKGPVGGGEEIRVKKGSDRRGIDGDLKQVLWEWGWWRGGRDGVREQRKFEGFEGEEMAVSRIAKMETS